MSKIIFNDFINWTNTNNEFTYINYINTHIDQNKIHPDFLVIFCKLFFPEFVLKNGMVFIKENFRENLFNQLVTDHNPNDKIEYWMNLIRVSSFFPDDCSYDKHAEFLCETINNSISKKLEIEFKNNIFKLITGYDDDDGYFFTFHQE
ncbi:hypothetical protein GCL60_04085 [Silvanigrella paludirubra]|uniref:Uncharacterized protein n=1 Tax=Silvanigrella paludirubra TaxID=2499159 RepID=A0A6N6VSZ6_9BACT|nr:hypothetical protein [Silvanigrella paludirubra]KAB8039440.1 hypothetical protein GCL60_04085 [Silvanigrella paludirubra]